MHIIWALKSQLLSIYLFLTLIQQVGVSGVVDKISSFQQQYLCDLLFRLSYNSTSHPSGVEKGVPASVGG